MVDSSEINKRIFENGEKNNILDNDILHNDATDEFVVNYVETELEPPIKPTKLQFPSFTRKRKSTEISWKTAKKPNHSSKLGIESVCPDICFFFLRDECVEGDDCCNSHELPTGDDVRQKLHELGAENTAKLFQVVIARCPKLLQNYFTLFVDYFVEQNLKSDLIKTIYICANQPEQKERFEYFQYLINAFIRSGDTYSTAMHRIFLNLRKITMEVANTLLNMNLVPGIDVEEFLNVFHSLSESRYQFHSNIINRMMYLCTQSEAVLSFDKISEFAQLILAMLKNNKQAQRCLQKDWYNSFLKLYNRILKI